MFFTNSKKSFFLTIVIISLFISQNTYSQSEKDTEIPTKIEKLTKQGLKIKLTESGSSYLKFGIGLQFWYRNLEMNPGTINKASELPISNYSDFALRRMRLSTLVNYEGRHYLYTQFGLTSHASYGDLHSGVFFHDLWYKAKIANKTYLGAGLHMWNGLSRLSNVTYATQITLDNPAINFPNVNVSDDFVRQYGVFFQGQLNRIDYAFSINQPLLSNNSSKILNDSEIISKGNYDIAYNRYYSNFSYNGYVSYSFLNTESVATTPFKKMTYYGKKGDFLTIGAGFQYANDASGILRNQNGTDYVEQHHQLSLSADLWYEHALVNESAFTIYAVYYNYDYGDNYLKSGAVMNGFSASDPNAPTAAQGAGISQFTNGTGHALYFSTSYVIPTTIINSKKKLMPFYALTYKDYEGVNEASFQHEFGAQYLILGDHLKLSAQYATRPIYDMNSLKVIDHQGAFIAQLQAKF